MKIAVSLFIASLTLGSVAFAAAPTAESLLADLHHANKMEIEMGKLAKKQGQSDTIKTYGDMLVKDHTDADKQVSDVAYKMGIKLPSDADKPMGQQNNTMDKLKSLNGVQFDKEFARTMSEDHAKDIEKVRTAKTALNGTPAGDLATNVLPALEKHKRIADDFLAKSK